MCVHFPPPSLLLSHFIKKGALPPAVASPPARESEAVICISLAKFDSLTLRAHVELTGRPCPCVSSHSGPSMAILTQLPSS